MAVEYSGKQQQSQEASFSHLTAHHSCQLGPVVSELQFSGCRAAWKRSKVTGILGFSLFHPPTLISICPLIYTSTHQTIHWSPHLFIHPLSVRPSIYLSMDSFIYSSIHPSYYPAIHPPTYPCILLSTSPLTHSPTYPSSYTPSNLSIHSHTYPPMHVTLQHRVQRWRD